MSIPPSSILDLHNQQTQHVFAQRSWHAVELRLEWHAMMVSALSQASGSEIHSGISVTERIHQLESTLISNSSLQSIVPKPDVIITS